MAKKSGRPKSRRRKAIIKKPCGCYYCCGDMDEEHSKRKLKIPKHKPKNWIEEDEQSYVKIKK